MATSGSNGLTNGERQTLIYDVGSLSSLPFSEGATQKCLTLVGRETCALHFGILAKKEPNEECRVRANSKKKSETLSDLDCRLYLFRVWLGQFCHSREYNRQDLDNLQALHRKTSVPSGFGFLKP